MKMCRECGDGMPADGPFMCFNCEEDYQKAHEEYLEHNLEPTTNKPITGEEPRQ